MARSAELLARLNATTARFDIGRGGVSELTNIDIAGALGMVRDPLGRELLNVIHVSPDAPGSLPAVREIMLRRVLHEAGARARSCIDAEIVALTATGEHDVRAARVAHDRAKARRFPLEIERIKGIIGAVLLELSKPKHCQACAGRGQVVGDRLVISCESCCGSGLTSRSNRDRADAIGVNESVLRRSPPLNALYDWCLSVMRDALLDAETDLRSALAKEVA